MARLFDEHIRRETVSLNGGWQFCIDPDDRGEAEGWFLGLPASQTVAVPSVWNTESGLLEYEGAAWYEKRFYSRGGCLRLCFGAVMTEAKIWLDGAFLGSHYGGFSQFDFIARDVPEGMHTLCVRADNRFDPWAIPQPMVDWYHYGGIIRDVSVERLNGLCVLGNRLEYTLSEDLSSAQCRLVLDCYHAQQDGETEVTVKLDADIVCQAAIVIPGGTRQEITLPEFTVDNLRLWSMEDPVLYTLTIETQTDDLIDRVGFRKVSLENGSVTLNGKPVEIRGVNRHEEHPDFGFAFPMQRMKHDIDLAVDMGCNAIRGSHYPNSQTFVDFLDERGILFWSEIPIWGEGFRKETLAEPVVLQRGLTMHKEMVKYYYNHPSIIFWGMHNEIKSDTPEGLEMSRQYYTYLKENGGNRLVVFASDHPLTDISFDYTDILCLNVYYGWYRGTLEDWADFIEQMCCRRRELGMEDKPILFSEFGAAAIYGFHDAECPKWSEEYQAKLMTHCLPLFHAHEAVCGFFIWQFSDVRSCKEMGFSRARGFNNKGVLNENRRPKAAYYAIQHCCRQFDTQ